MTINNNDDDLGWSNRKRLIAIAKRVLGNSDDAEDVVQETLLATWRLSHQIEPSALPRYLTRAVRQNAIKRRIRQREFTPLLESQHAPHSIHQLDTSAIELEEAIHSLPPAQQQIIRMRYYADMTLSEISSSLTISLDTVASRCRYAVQKLQTFFHSNLRNSK